MVGPKPKPVRPLNAAKPGFEKPTENKSVAKKKSKKVESKLPSKETKVDKDVSKVSVKPTESKEKKKSKNSDPAAAPSKERKILEKMQEPAYPEPGQVCRDLGVNLN